MKRIDAATAALEAATKLPSPRRYGEINRALRLMLVAIDDEQHAEVARFEKRLGLQSRGSLQARVARALAAALQREQRT